MKKTKIRKCQILFFAMRKTVSYGSTSERIVCKRLRVIVTDADAMSLGFALGGMH